MPVILLALLLSLIVPAPAAARGGRVGWLRPVDGAVLGRFAVGSDPYAAGQRRGVDLAATRGELVRAPCSGRVSYAGAVPGRRLGVSLRCGRLTATVLGLGRVRVRAGAPARRGAPLGVVAGAGPLRLGARVTDRRHGYVDPLSLIGPRDRPPSPVMPLRGPTDRRGLPLGGPIELPVGHAAERHSSPSRVPARPHAAPVPASRPTGVPLAAWIGLALAAAAIPAAVSSRQRRARRVPRAEEVRLAQ